MDGDADPLELHDVRPEDRRTHELLEALIEEIRGLRAELGNRRDAAPRVDREDRDLLDGILPAIASATGARAFTVSELQRHARLAEFANLRAAIDRAGGGNRLGRLLKRAAGYEIAGLRVEHIGEDREGLVFTVASCGELRRDSPLQCSRAA